MRVGVVVDLTHVHWDHHEGDVETCLIPAYRGRRRYGIAVAITDSGMEPLGEIEPTSDVFLDLRWESVS